jgi:hypothetical protein
MEDKPSVLLDHSQSTLEYLEVQLADLFDCPQKEDERALAARFAPLIRLDVNEPFRPLAAGYTIFRKDGRSPSFPRRIRLGGARRPAAALVIEYAIWWDWDINHLYELEHIWVYVDPEDQVVAVEGSWHGKVNDLVANGRPITSGSNPVVLAAPGKHAFAPNISHFQENQARIPGLTTRFAGTNGIVVSELFAAKIWRTPPWDRLVQSYLTTFAFKPGWNFNRLFRINEGMLVPWPAMQAWIPERVHAWIGQLERDVTPDRYRFLRVAVCATRDEILRAGELEMDMVQLHVGRNRLGLPVLLDAYGKPTRTGLAAALRRCQQARTGAYLIVEDARVISWLARFLGRVDWSDYLMTGAAHPDWSAAIKQKLPHYRTSLIAAEAPDVAVAAPIIGPGYVHLTDPPAAQLVPDWIDEVHRAGIGVVCGPVNNKGAMAQLASLRIDAIVATDPRLFAL